MNAFVLLLVLTSTIVLRSGDRIAVEGEINESRGIVTFRSAGRLYSMPGAEIDRIENGDKSAAPGVRATAAKEERDEKDRERVRRLAVSDEERKRLLEALERNHSGTAVPPSNPREIPPPPSREEAKEQRREENAWRREARAHEEAIRRANEELALLESRVDELRSQIHGFISLGYQPNQFTYQTTVLERTLQQIPYARLEVTRAERAYNEFREDARRNGVMPGWLR